MLGEVQPKDIFNNIMKGMKINSRKMQYKHFKLACVHDGLLSEKNFMRTFRFLLSDPQSTKLTCNHLKNSMIRSGAIYPSFGSV
jgi:hypothetical protein